MIDLDLLELWQRAAKDPDKEAPLWLKNGAPAGIFDPVLDCGIFPLYDPAVDQAEINAVDLATEPRFCNYFASKRTRMSQRNSSAWKLRGM